MRSSRVPVTTNTEVFNIFCLRIETFTKIAVALKFSQLENLMQKRLFSKKLRIYEFIDLRLPFHRFFKHQSWTTLKPKYWQYFSYLIAEDFENYIICITKSQSCKVLSHYFQLLFRTKPSELWALHLLFWQCIVSHPFPGEKHQGNITDADGKLWEDKVSAGPIHYLMWAWNYFF